MPTVTTGDIPEPIMRRAATVLCDDIAAIVAARDEPEVIKLQDRMVSRARSKESTVFNGRGGKADRFSAAVANGAAADWCELDEGYRRATCHAGLYVIPALIAEAEATGASTEETLRALVLGYEVAARFARAFPPKALVLHPHASLAAIGAAAGVGALRKLDAKLLNAAVTSASTMVAPGPYRHAVEGALVRNVWPAAGAWCGMQAVEWAECGIGGAPHSPYDVFVVGVQFASLRRISSPAGLGDEWAIADGYHKVHACCQYSHSTVEAIIGLHDQLGDKMKRVQRVAVETHPLGMTLDNREPATSLAAKFSIPHIAAAACLYGHAGAEAFAGSHLNDAPLAELREKVAACTFRERAGLAERPSGARDRHARRRLRSHRRMHQRPRRPGQAVRSGRDPVEDRRDHGFGLSEGSGSHEAVHRAGPFIAGDTLAQCRCAARVRGSEILEQSPSPSSTFGSGLRLQERTASQEPAIDDDAFAVDVVRGMREEKPDRCGNILRTADPAARDHSYKRLFVLG